MTAIERIHRQSEQDRQNKICPVCWKKTRLEKTLFIGLPESTSIFICPRCGNTFFEEWYRGGELAITKNIGGELSNAD